MQQVTRFFPLMISGVIAGVMGYYGTVDAAQQAFNAHCARINRENNDPNNAQRGKKIAPTLLGIFSSLVDVPDLRDLDPFTKGFILKYIELRQPDALVHDLQHFIGPDSIVYLDHWCRWFQASERWLSNKEAVFSDGTLIWEPELAGAFVCDLLQTGACQHPNAPEDLSEDEQEFLAACCHDFLNLATELPEFRTRSGILYEGREIWSVVYDDNNDLA